MFSPFPWNSRYRSSPVFDALFPLKIDQICIFDAILSGKSGFLMMRPKCAYFMHYYVEKQFFSWRAPNVQIVALLRGKAGFLMTRQKGVNLLH